MWTDILLVGAGGVIVFVRIGPVAGLLLLLCFGSAGLRGWLLRPLLHLETPVGSIFLIQDCVLVIPNSRAHFLKCRIFKFQKL